MLPEQYWCDLLNLLQEKLLDNVYETRQCVTCAWSKVFMRQVKNRQKLMQRVEPTDNFSATWAMIAPIVQHVICSYDATCIAVHFEANCKNYCKLY